VATAASTASSAVSNRNGDLLIRHLEAVELQLRSTGIVVDFLLIGREFVC
jgi:hypothetical protein